MKRWILAGLAGAALTVAAILSIFLYPASDGGAPPLSGSLGEFELTGKPAPDIAFSTADGRTVRLADMARKVVLINLWATWCAPCVREMPTLDRLQADLGGEDFEVVALSSDRTGDAAVAPFYEANGLNHLATYLDPNGEATRALGVRGLPTTVLIDRGGREVGRLEGVAEWDSAEAKALVRHYVEKHP